MKKANILIFIFIMLISFASSYDLHQQNTNYSYQETVANAESCTLTKITYPDGSSGTLNITMDNDDFNFYTEIESSNFSQSGDVCWGIVCYDSDATPEYTSSRKCLTVTPSGKDPSIANSLAHIILILFLVFLIVSFYFVSKDIKFEKWYNSIILKYQNKNYIKLVLSSLAYNIMKNTFVVYYLIGLPILLSLTDLAYNFGITSLIDIMKILIGVYLIGAIIMAIYFLSYVQEWIMNLFENISKLDWGVED